MSPFLLFVILNIVLVCGQKDKLPAPQLFKVTTFDLPGFTVEWMPLEIDEANPILGYKVKVWESEKETFYTPANIPGLEDVWIKEFRPVEISINAIPKTVPIVKDVEANATEARFEGVKLNEDYQVRVQAYDEDGDGPYSNLLSVKLHDADADDEVEE